MEQSNSLEASSYSASQEIHRNLRNPGIITVFTEVRYLSISWAILTQFTPCNLVSVRSILIYFHLCLVPRTDLLPSGFPIKTFYAFVFSPILMSRPSHSPWFDCSNILWGGQIMMFFIMHFSPVFFYLFTLTSSFPQHTIREHPQPTIFP